MDIPPPIVQETVISVRGLTKRFDRKVAVDHLDLDVAGGEWFAFLGPNGSGKSTTIRMMTGMLPRTSGTVSIFGLDPDDHPLEVKRRIGFMPEEPLLYDRMTPREHIRFLGPLYGLTIVESDRRGNEIFDLLELAVKDRDRHVVDFSMGMRKKVSLAAALLHGPRVLFLDEPFNGIDAVTTHAIKLALTEAVSRGVTVFFSSHVLEQVERLCRRLAIIASGRVLAAGSLDDVRRTAGLDATATLEDSFLRLVGGGAADAPKAKLGFLG